MNKEGRPKVLFLHQGAELYGSDFIFYLVVRAMARYVEPIVVLDNEGPLVEKLGEVCDTVLVRPLGVLRRKYMNLRGAFTLLGLLVSASWGLRKLIKREGVVLVYSNTIGVLPGALAAKLTGRPHLSHIHEIIVKPRLLGRMLSWFALTLSDGVVGVSGPVAQHLAAMVPGKAEKVTVIHNGLSTQPFDEAEGGHIRREFGLDDEMPFIAMVGRIHFWKGQDFLIEAARIMKEQGATDFRIAVVGDVFPGYEALLDELKDKVAAYGLEEQVLFCGFRRDVARFLKDADIVVLPSTLPDPLPTVVLEAMASRKPVVATAHGGALEMVDDGITGYLVSPDDPEAMAHRLLELAQNRALQHEMGRRGRERFERMFTIERFEQDIAACIRAHLDAHPVHETA